jgi:hypothetical protein
MDAQTYNSIMQALSSGDRGQANALLSQVISQRAAEDPRMALLLQSLAQQQAATAEEVEDDLEPGYIPARGANHEPQGNHPAVQQVKEKVIALYKENLDLRQSLDMFTRAVGACICRAVQF